ncbi:MAG: SAM-dependent DNA methyltransferase [Thermodesulfobacteriota bacterium]
MHLVIDDIEQQRVALQADLDAKKTQAERNRLGQFATPTGLARDILKYAYSLIPQKEKVSFLDPAIGTGAFYSALLKIFPKNRIEGALGFEIDSHYGDPSALLWKNSGLTLKLGDFTNEEPSGRFNLVTCNPPYVRHHHLQNGNKFRLQSRTLRASGLKLSGLAGLYCHFLGLSHAWMAKGGVAGWLIPSEFMDVNYGQAVKRYLLERVTLLHIHRFDPNEVQFADALVSSAVVWFRNTPPPPYHAVSFTLGGTLLEPGISRSISARELALEPKWTRFPAAAVRPPTTSPKLSDFFQIKRGIATGNNNYFILSEEDVKTHSLPMQELRPILPSPRYLPDDEVKADKDGNPIVARRLFLLDTHLSESDIKARFPQLWTYLEKGKAQGLHERYLCSHRFPWYSQENRPPAPILCTYIGRGDTKRGCPFRFILNDSRATVANVYLAMYPTPLLARTMKNDKTLIRKLWRELNAISAEKLLGEGRVYGGGLFKLEPKELANVDASAIAELIPDWQLKGKAKQLVMFG